MLLQTFQKGLGPFLIVESERRANPPPSSPINPNASNENFEIAIFFNTVEMSGNYVFDDDAHHSPQDKGCKLCPGGILGSYRKIGHIN